jgi:hypothetical protein
MPASVGLPKNFVETKGERWGEERKEEGKKDEKK